MKQGLKLRNNDQRIVNRGREIQRAQRLVKSIRSHVITASRIKKPRFVTWGDRKGNRRLRHVPMKQGLKLRDNDQRIVNRGREIRRAYSGCMWKRKETTRLILFLFVKPLFAITLRDVIT